MTDFYTLLKQSIIDRGLREPEDRDITYAQARKAMIRRLWSFDPPLSEEEIDVRIGQFDRAVDRIEMVVAEAFARMDDDDAGDAETIEPAASEAPALAGYDDADYEDDDDTAGAAAGDPLPYDLTVAEARDTRASDTGKLDTGALAELLATLDVRSVAVEEALNADPVDDEPPPPPKAEKRPAHLPVPVRTRARPIEIIEEAPDDRPPVNRPRGDRPRGDTRPARIPRSQLPVEEPESYDVAPEPVALSRRSAPPMRAARPRQPQPETRHPPARKPRPTSAAQKPARKAAPKPKQKRSSSGANRQIATLLVAVVALAVALIGLTAYVLWPGGSDEGPAIAAGSAPGPATPQDLENRITLFDGGDPTVFNADPSNPIRFDGSVARISTSAGSAGARALIGPGLAASLAGRNVRITLMARGARENAAPNLRFAYQSGLAVSHWQSAQLTTEFTPVALEWRVPKLRTDSTGNAILIEPGIPGDGTAVEISAITIDIVG